GARAAALVVNGPFVFTSPGGSLRLLKNGSNLEIRDAGNNVLAARPLSTVTSLTIDGADGVANALTIDYSAGGFFTIPGTIAFNGGTGAGPDSLNIVG